MDFAKRGDSFVAAPFCLLVAEIRDADFKTLFSDLFELGIFQRESREVVPIVRASSFFEKISDRSRDLFPGWIRSGVDALLENVEQRN